MAVDPTSQDIELKETRKSLERSPSINVNEFSAVSSTPPANAALAFSEGAFPEGTLESWTVVAACSVIFFWFLGAIYSWGIFSAALEAQSVAPAAQLALVGALGPGLEVLLAIPASSLCVKIGVARVAALGSLLCGIGPFLASFTVHNIVGLIMTQGIIFGVGCSFCFNSCASLPAQYFLRKRGLATGLMYSAGGVGGAVVALALSNIVKTHGLAWAFRVLGICTATCCIPVSFLLKARFTDKAAGKLDWSLFRDVQFSLLFFSGLTGVLPIFVCPFLLPSFVRVLGYSDGTGAWLLAGYSLSSAAGRLLIGVASDTFFGPLNSILFSQVLMSVSLLVVWTLSANLGPLILFVILNGGASGAFFALSAPVTAQLFKNHSVQMTLSLLITAWTIGNFTGSPISGALLDASSKGKDTLTREDYLGAILFAGGLAVVSAVLLALLRIRADRKILKKL